MFVGIDSVYCNGRETYRIKNFGDEKYIDKETGYAVRWIQRSSEKENGKIDWVVDYEYKFNVVQDSDIQKPDTTNLIYE